eukprot:TRINITY_DN8739_c0_g1_i2.p1 TRINITY_DN8739_c0_g1~~TRINITY_DN8739_c0_g1_i2.p1  ORF type:complete len:332 (+),score=63.52 TRINITY_DN8739_c0_g1_i2:112-1107(+)
MTSSMAAASMSEATVPEPAQSVQSVSEAETVAEGDAMSDGEMYADYGVDEVCGMKLPKCLYFNVAKQVLSISMSEYYALWNAGEDVSHIVRRGSELYPDYAKLDKALVHRIQIARGELVVRSRTRPGHVKSPHGAVAKRPWIDWKKASKTRAAHWRLRWTAIEDGKQHSAAFLPDEGNLKEEELALARAERFQYKLWVTGVARIPHLQETQSTESGIYRHNKDGWRLRLTVQGMVYEGFFSALPAAKKAKSELLVCLQQGRSDLPQGVHRKKSNKAACGCKRKGGCNGAGIHKVGVHRKKSNKAAAGGASEVSARGCKRKGGCSGAGTHKV